MAKQLGCTVEQVPQDQAEAIVVTGDELKVEFFLSVPFFSFPIFLLLF
jgi:hypothetical protein